MNKETGKEPKACADSLLDDFALINRKAEEHGLDDAFTAAAAPSLKAVSEAMKISPVQAALLALLLERSGSDAASLEGIAQAVHCGKIQAMKYLDDLEALERRYLIAGTNRDLSDLLSFTRQRDNSGSRVYTVPLDVIKAIRAGTAYRYTAYNNLTPDDFFETADNLLDAFTSRDIDRRRLDMEVKNLIMANRELAFTRELKAHSYGGTSAIVLLVFSCALLRDGRESIPLKTISVFTGGSFARRLQNEIQIGNHKLIKDGILEHDHDHGIADTEYYRLTEKAKETFLADVDPKHLGKLAGKSLIKADAITKRELFYPEKTQRRIAELSALLHEKNFGPIKKRLAGQKMRNGFACLFSGPPGTGKTETAYQIARETDRDIFLVDIAETKSMWFGENEKRIKAVFDRYHSLIKSISPAPILLFNEADAILGKRQELGDQRRGPAQTENAIQNIILQEMENLDGGILIATTNMTINLDKAFERRFLYKIEFEKPDAEAKTAIW
ncbi:MAG: AAA family ATPase, partial [Spirochaetaceae bacterium]|nr:AAA family ATPase [Spirochaetaceae bacterium]